jgi:succinoglycan biosynthesis transport protein ExoP
MLKRIDEHMIARPQAGAEPDAPKSDGPIDLNLLVGVGRRQAHILVFAALVGLLAGFAYIITAVPKYTATTQILIDSQKDKIDGSTSIVDLMFDTGAIDSQVEVLKSDRIALAVVSKLNLMSDPHFMMVRATPIDRARAMLRTAFNLSRWFEARTKSQPEVDESSPQRNAISELQNNLTVRRIGRSYVLAIDYTSPHPKLAAAIANAFADAYLAEQLDSKYEAAQRTSGWLLSRIAELKKESLRSDSAVQKFKADHGLVSADGKLVSDQQLSELSAQLMTAQNDTARAEALFNQITDILKSGNTDGAVTDLLGIPVLTELRQKFLAFSGSRPALAAEYKRQILEELKRTAESYRSESEVAKAKEESLKKSMAALTGENAKTNEALVQSRELEREADAYRTLYESSLQRYQEVIEKASAQVAEARVITTASQPNVPSYPKRSFVMALSLVFGTMVGVGVGALREYRGSRVFRTASQVRDELRLEFLGMLQVLNAPVILKRSSDERRDPKKIKVSDSRLRYSADHPLSRYAETLRSVKLAADLSLSDREPKIIGVISALPNEGKTTLSKNFATFLANLGATTLLIDGDLRHCGLTRSIATHADLGILQAVRGECALRDALLLEPDSGLLVLPAVIRRPLHHPGEVLSSPGMRGLLTEAGTDFDYIIVDLPPLGPVIDVRAAASVFSAFVMVVEWGRTVVPMVKSILDSDDLLYNKCIGIVYNKVQMNKIMKYEGHSSKDYFHGDYGRYYRQ